MDKFTTIVLAITTIGCVVELARYHHRLAEWKDYERRQAVREAVLAEMQERKKREDAGNDLP